MAGITVSVCSRVLVVVCVLYVLAFTVPPCSDPLLCSSVYEEAALHDLCLSLKNCISYINHKKIKLFVGFIMRNQTKSCKTLII